jgi:hypothetical protein|nr:MAG TPA: replisome organizer protein [Caudoviricetes sp.]
MLVKIRITEGKPDVGVDELDDFDAAFLLRLLVAGASGTQTDMDAFLDFVHESYGDFMRHLEVLFDFRWVCTIGESADLITVSVVAPPNCKMVLLGAAKRPVRGRYTDGFEAFWKAYPRRVNKAKAFRAWKSAVETVSEETLIDAAKRYAAYHDAVSTDRQYIKHPTTWLNGGEWDSVPMIPSLLRKPPSPEYESLHIDDLEAWVR